VEVSKLNNNNRPDCLVLPVDSLEEIRVQEPTQIINGLNQTITTITTTGINLTITIIGINPTTTEISQMQTTIGVNLPTITIITGINLTIITTGINPIITITGINPTITLEVQMEIRLEILEAAGLTLLVDGLVTTIITITTTTTPINKAPLRTPSLD
jgi:hypothetical protein